MNWSDQCVVVIPCLNEREGLQALIKSVQQFLPHVIVVDDGSTDGTAEQAANTGAEVVQHPHSLGKGAALKRGWRRARARGFGWALTMDGDGQHAADDIPVFLEQAGHTQAPLIVGNRMLQADAMPLVRRWTNRWMSGRLSKLTGRNLPDSQCGFRLVRLQALDGMVFETDHFEIESEMLVRFAEAQLAIEFVPVRVIYGARQSKIHVLQDSWRWLRWWARMRFKTDSHGTFRRLLVRLTLVAIAAFCIGPLLNRAAGLMQSGQPPAGFVRGVVHGAMMPCTLPTLLVGRELQIYERNNNGRLYNLGYTVGVNGCGAIFFGLLYWRLGRKRAGQSKQIVGAPSARPASQT